MMLNNIDECLLNRYKDLQQKHSKGSSSQEVLSELTQVVGEYVKTKGTRHESFQAILEKLLNIQFKEKKKKLLGTSYRSLNFFEIVYGKMPPSIKEQFECNIKPLDISLINCYLRQVTESDETVLYIPEKIRLEPISPMHHSAQNYYSPQTPPLQSPSYIASPEQEEINLPQTSAGKMREMVLQVQRQHHQKRLNQLDENTQIAESTYQYIQQLNSLTLEHNGLMHRDITQHRETILREQQAKVLFQQQEQLQTHSFIHLHQELKSKEEALIAEMDRLWQNEREQLQIMQETLQLAQNCEKIDDPQNALHNYKQVYKQTESFVNAGLTVENTPRIAQMRQKSLSKQSDIYISRKEYKKAEKCLKALVKMDAQDQGSQLKLVAVYEQQGKFEEAMVILDALAELGYNTDEVIQKRETIKEHLAQIYSSQEIEVLHKVGKLNAHLTKNQEKIEKQSMGSLAVVAEKVKVSSHQSDEQLAEFKNQLIEQGFESEVLTAQQQKLANAKDLCQLEAEKENLQQRVEQLTKELGQKSRLEEQVQQLLENQALLLKDYNKRQSLLEQQEYIEKQPKLKAFYDRFQLKLTEYFLACKVINSGAVKREDNLDKSLGTVNTVTRGVSSIANSSLISLAGTAIDIFAPGAGLAVTIGAKCVSVGAIGLGKTASLSKKLREGTEVVKISRVSMLTSNISSMDKLAEEVARRLTQRYESQINKLTLGKKTAELTGKIKVRLGVSHGLKNGGVEELAEYAVARIIEAMQLGCIDPLQKEATLVEQLIGCVFYQRSKEGFISLLKSKTVAIEPEYKIIGKWRPKGIFQGSGIVTENEMYFTGDKKHKYCHKSTLYGFRRGDESEVKKLNLNECPSEEVSELCKPKLFGYNF